MSNWIPGWDSAAGASLWSNIFFWVGIAALLVVGISEVVSHRCGERKNELVREQQAATERHHDEEMARLHLETDQASERAVDLEKETAAASVRAEELKLALEKEIAARPPRTISPENREKILSALKADPAPKGHIVVVWKLFDQEAFQFGQQIISLLNDGGFDAVPGDGSITFEESGQWLVVRDLHKLSTPETP
jgi:hypothetical protein